MSISQPFVPTQLIGHAHELKESIAALQHHQNCLITGVPGSGRSTLIRVASQKIEARVIEIDCIQTTNFYRFLQLFSKQVVDLCQTPIELQSLKEWSLRHSPSVNFVWDTHTSAPPRLAWNLTRAQEWNLFDELLEFLQLLGTALNCTIVIAFKNFTHIQSWDRQDQWKEHLASRMKQKTPVIYILMASIAADWLEEQTLARIELLPITDSILEQWVVQEMNKVDLQFDSNSQVLDLFLSYVQGHLGDTIALGRRVWTDYQAKHAPSAPRIITSRDVRDSMLSLIEDISVTFESLLLQLPPIQIRVLESLCLDPTEKPHSKHYIKKHLLSRGGSLQGALNSLQQKGLIYGPSNHYRVALPLLDFWLKQRLSSVSTS